MLVKAPFSLEVTSGATNFVSIPTGTGCIILVSATWKLFSDRELLLEYCFTMVTCLRNPNPTRIRILNQQNSSRPSHPRTSFFAWHQLFGSFFRRLTDAGRERFQSDHNQDLQNFFDQRRRETSRGAINISHCSLVPLHCKTETP